MTSARLAAARILLAVERGKTTLAAEVDRARREVSARDHALLLELAAGTLRWQNELDAVIEPVARRAVASLDPEVRASLRLGVYQLRHLDRVPVHAVVNESVEVTRQLGRMRSAGFVNAVLRNLVRKQTSGLPDRPASGDSRTKALAYLSRTLSHPEWLVARWLDRWGFDAAEAWCQFNNASPDLTVKSLRGLAPGALVEALTGEGVDAQPARYVLGAVRLAPGSLGRLSSTWRDELVVQEEASQIVALAAGVRPGARVLDLCAAPGGKTIILSERLAGHGLLIASDHRPARVRLLSATVRKAQAPARVLSLDATQPLPFGPIFDVVLVDAPCSGLGVLRRDPDLKWSRHLDDLPRFAEMQRRMLAHAAGVVAPGGRLLYATCSSEPDENDAVVDQFLVAHSEFALTTPDFGGTVEDAATLLDSRGFLRTLPFTHRLDAFFGAVLARSTLLSA